jgi:beta-glucanase (GH16 family)
VNWAGYNEIDMGEFYNYPSGWPHFNIFASNGNGNLTGQNYPAAPVDTVWHTYATVWTATGISQYLDDVVQVSTSNTINDTLFFIFQTQTGGSGGTPNNSLLPASLYLDYIKVCNSNYTLSQCEAAATDGSDPNVIFYDDFGGPAQ